MISKSFHPIFRAVKEHSTASRSKLHRLEKREYDECEEKFHLACGCLFWAYKWYLILHNVTFPVYHRAVDTSCRGERRRPVKEEAADAQVVCKQIIMIIYDRFMRTAHFYLMPGPSLARLIGKLFRKIRRKSFFYETFPRRYLLMSDWNVNDYPRRDRHGGTKMKAWMPSHKKLININSDTPAKTRSWVWFTLCRALCDYSLTCINIDLDAFFHSFAFSAFSVCVS